MNEIRNVKFIEPARKEKKVTFWENLQLMTLGLTIFGQITVGWFYLLGQTAWLIANVIALSRDFILQRALADKIKDACLTAITVGLVITGVFL